MALIMEVEQAWLARTFVEYELLPHLLALLGTAGLHWTATVLVVVSVRERVQP